MTDFKTAIADSDAQGSQLGKATQYPQRYSPNLLYPIPRADKRREIGIDPETSPFYGVDYWNHYETSWLNAKGKPMVAIAEIYYDCHSTAIVESKSLKLYLNSFNSTCFDSTDKVIETIKKDLQASLNVLVSVTLHSLDRRQEQLFQSNFDGKCIDKLDVSCSTYVVNPGFLSVENELVTEVLYSNLLKSNCPVTHQPDWGSVQIAYQGKKINPEGLLRYLVSFRNHNDFHEQCIERIFMDILRNCQPEELTIYGRYTRRGGLDINPYRSTKKAPFNIKNHRLSRQ